MTRAQKQPNRLFILIVLALSLGTSSIYAQSLRSQTERDSGRIGISGEFQNFAFSTGSIVGTGLKADFTHFFKDNWGVEVFLSTALQSSGANAFNGFGSYIFYGLSECCDTVKTLTFNNDVVLKERSSVGRTYQFGFGLNQFLFNGSEGIYSLSGPGIAAQMVTTLWNLPFKFGARYTLLANGDITANGIGFTIGLSF